MTAARRAIALGLIVLGAVVGGCGSGSEPDPGETALAAPLTISRGGGIAGTLYETTVEPDGTGVFDERDLVGPEVEPEGFDVGDARLAKLAEVAAQTPFGEIGEAIEPACADCFVYEITYGEESLRVDSATLGSGEAGEAAGPLIAALESVGPDPDQR